MKDEQPEPPTAARDVTADRVRRLTRGPQPPKDYRVEVNGTTMRHTIIDRSRDSTRSGTVTYVFGNAQDVDTLTQAGVDAGAARAVIVGQVSAPGTDGAEASCPIVDEKYKSGVFYCWGVDGSGNRSGSYLWFTTGVAGLKSTIPGDVRALQISESGRTQNGTVVSMLSVACIAPDDGCAGVQLFLRDYIQLGSMAEGAFGASNGVPRSAIQFEAPYAPSRRAGAGTVTMTPGFAAVAASGGLLAIAQQNDEIEVYGLRATIVAVTDTSLTLSAPWAGQAGTTADFTILGYITVFAVAVSEAKTHRSDIENAPFVAMLFDAELSAPNAPTIVGANRGDAVVLTFQQILGTEIKGYRVLRGYGDVTGAGGVSACSVIGWVEQPKASAAASSITPLEYVDKAFTDFQRQQQDVFTYYVETVNERDDASVPSNAIVIACRLDGADDNGPQTPARNIPLNLLWNGMLWFNAAATVDATNANQDTKMGGGVPPAGFSRIDHEESAATATCGFTDAAYIVMPSPGLGKYSGFHWILGGWNAAAGAQRIPQGAYVVLQWKAITTGGAPDGLLRADISQLNAGVFQAFAKVRQRVSTDQFVETAVVYDVDPSDLYAAGRLYWACFHLNASLTTTDVIVRIYRQDGTSAANVLATQAMLSIGQSLPAWTAQMVDPNISYPPPTGGHPSFPPGGFEGGDGRGVLRLPA